MIDPIPDPPPPAPPVYAYVRYLLATFSIVGVSRTTPYEEAAEGEGLYDVMDPDEAAKLLEPGAKTINPTTGVITVTPPAPPPPIPYDDQMSVREVQTTDATPRPVTYPIAVNTTYIITTDIHGVMEGSPFDRMLLRKSVMVSRATGAAVLDVNLDIHAPFRSAGATNWQAVVSVGSGNIIVTLTGQASRVINWTIRSTFFRINKQGLVP